MDNFELYERCWLNNMTVEDDTEADPHTQKSTSEPAGETHRLVLCHFTTVPVARQARRLLKCVCCEVF